jgi:nicotinamidase-related amidase
VRVEVSRANVQQKSYSEDFVAVVPVYQSLKETVGPAHTALVVIDVQNDFRVSSYEPMIARLQRLLAAGRDAGLFIVYIQNSVLPGVSNSPAEIARRMKLGLPVDVTVAGSDGEKIVAAISPEPGEVIIRKHRLNAFAGTDLEMLLQNRGIETVVITGVATHGCVTGTSYAAQGLNHYVVVVEDCVDSWKPDLHDAALHVLRNTMNYVTSADTLLEIWRPAAGGTTHSHERRSLGTVS